jgi:hypothetical protein
LGITDYISYLTDADRLRFYFETKRGRVIKFVAQYETLIDEKWYPVIRYDTVHGFAHKDILDRRGRVIEKIKLTDMDYEHALIFAEDDINSNWELYKRRFLRGRRK